jgi:TolB-like protein
MVPMPSSMQTSKPGRPISDDEIRGLVRKIAASPGFFRAARMQRFLYFVVEGTLIGESRRESLKESVIAIAVFDRDPDYDPKSDPVVRVEARRLRAKLEQYYDGPGKEEAIRIDIPKGSYVPMLRRQGQPAVTTKQVSGTRVRRWVGLALTASVLVAIAVFGGGIDWGARLFGSHAEIRSLAVLPFRNLSADQTQDYLIDGLTDEITTDLANIRSLKVISRTSADSYRKTGKRLPEIARELNVDAIVEGTVLGSRNRIRVTAQLIRAATDSHLWAGTYERDGDDLFPLQAEIAENIARQIGATVRPAPTKRAGGQSLKPTAYNAYLMGRYFWNKRRLGDLEPSN